VLWACFVGLIALFNYAARISNAGAYTHAGHEIGVASTKAFTAQLAVLTMIALKIARVQWVVI